MDEDRKGEGASKKYNATGITVGGARMACVSGSGAPSEMRYKVVIHLMDDVIDPAESRRWIVHGMDAAGTSGGGEWRHREGKARPLVSPW